MLHRRRPVIAPFPGGADALPPPGWTPSIADIASLAIGFLTTYSASFLLTRNITPAELFDGLSLSRKHSESPTPTAPLHAWKAANVVEGDPRFHPWGRGVPYFHDDPATCSRGFHRAPSRFCRCGYYAVIDPFSLWGMTNCLLEVEVYGKVIIHTAGYRASRQRILCAYIRHPTMTNMAEWTSLLGVECRPISAARLRLPPPTCFLPSS